MVISSVHIEDLVGSRIDPMPFHPERLKILEKINASKKGIRLKNLVSNVKTITKSISEEDIYIGLENIKSHIGQYVPTSEKGSISSAAVFKKGNILFPKLRPYLNKVYRAEFDGLCSTEFYVFEAKNIDADFLTIVLRSNFVLKQTKHLTTGNTLPRLQTVDVDNLLIPVPSEYIQKDIVSLYLKAQEDRSDKIRESERILKSIDSLLSRELGVNLSEKQISRAFKTSISSIIGTRLDTYFHQPFFEKEFEAIKKSTYSVLSLKNISECITSGITPTSGGKDYTDSETGIAFIRSGDIDIDGDINFDNLLYITPEIHNTKMKSSKVKRNDIMIAIVGATIGQIGIYLSDREANINQAIALVRVKKGINPEYIKEVLSSSIGQLNLDRLKRPVARANINLEEIGSILIPVPELIQQNEIVKKVKEIRSKAKKLQNEGDELLQIAKQKIEQLILE